MSIDHSPILCVLLGSWHYYVYAHSLESAGSWHWEVKLVTTPIMLQIETEWQMLMSSSQEADMYKW
jgi:hypothetical protein